MPGSKSDKSSEMLEQRRSVGARIVHARKSREVKRPELAVMIGVDPDHLGRLERGESWPGGMLIVKLCETLDVTPSWLLMGLGEGPDESVPAQTIRRRPFELAARRSTPPKAAPMRKLPDAVAAFLLSAGDSLSPELVKRLKEFDYSELDKKKLTRADIQKLASILDPGAKFPDH